MYSHGFTDHGFSDYYVFTHGPASHGVSDHCVRPWFFQHSVSSHGSTGSIHTSVVGSESSRVMVPNYLGDMVLSARVLQVLVHCELTLLVTGT